MHRITAIALSSVLVLSCSQLFSQTNSGIEKTLQAKEQAAWQSWKDHDSSGLGAIMTNDAVNIAGGTMTKGRDEIVKGISGCSVSSFSLSGFSYQWLSKDTVLLTYTAAQDAICGGRKLPVKVIASSVWQRRGGQWLSPFHQETPAGM